MFCYSLSGCKLTLVNVTVFSSNDKRHVKVYIPLFHRHNCTFLLFRPPIIRVNDKVMIPQDDHPEINFVGLLIGPRGNTLKNLEKDVSSNSVQQAVKLYGECLVLGGKSSQEFDIRICGARTVKESIQFKSHVSHL